MALVFCQSSGTIRSGGIEDEDELIIADLDLSMIDEVERPGSSIGIDGLKPTMNWLNTNGG